MSNPHAVSRARAAEMIGRSPGTHSGGFRTWRPTSRHWCTEQCPWRATLVRYGYRRAMGLLHLEGCFVNHERVERIWKEEGLKVPKK